MKHPLVRPAVLTALLVAVAALPALAAQEWTVLKDCRLIRTGANDADSFHVSAGGKEYVFRLYFVDAPETDASFPERVKEQAKYFGLTTQQALQLGEVAQRFTREKLAQPFTVRTAMQDARGRGRHERYYAFITTKEGDLAELLVANGLARLHGAEAKPIGLTSPERMWQKLERLEREAKYHKVGAWGAPVGGMTARLPKQPATSGPDSFDAFFHPERLAAPAEQEIFVQPTASVTPATQASSKGGKLDPNTATSEQLLAVPGIGPAIAKNIIEARPFKSADELRRVKLIGTGKRYEQIRPYFD